MALADDDLVIGRTARRRIDRACPEYSDGQPRRALAPISQVIAQRNESPADQKGGEQDQEKYKGKKRGERARGTSHQALQPGRERLSHRGL
jgi:hypothetical protein